MPPVEIFEQLIRHPNPDALVDFLLHLPSSAQAAVRRRSLALQHEWATGRHDAASTWPQSEAQDVEFSFFLTGLAVYGRRDAEQAGARGFDLLSQPPRSRRAAHRLAQVQAVLEYARPNWLTDWLLNCTQASQLATPDFHLLLDWAGRGLLEPPAWLLAQAAARQLVTLSELTGGLRELEGRVAAGQALSPAQQDDWDYLHATWPALTSGAPRQDVADLVFNQLSASPQLLQQGLPLLFEVDTPVDTAQGHDARTQAHITWQAMLTRLAAAGHLRRADLLTRCLLALRGDFRRPLLMWYKELYLSLKPSAAERLCRQPELRALLEHPLALVVNFAIGQLRTIWTAPDFDLAALLPHAEPLLARTELKTSLKYLLTLFDKALKDNPAHAPTLADPLTTALAHSDAAVQESAARTLAGVLGSAASLLTAAQTETTLAHLLQLADTMTPPARAALQPWLPESATAAPETADAYQPLTDFVPDLSLSEELLPVADWHELLFLTGEVLHHQSPLALERWLEGLLRLRPRFPADYAAAMRPYALQALPGQLADDAADPQAALEKASLGTGYPGLLQALVLSLATGLSRPRVEAVALDKEYEVADPLVALEKQRFGQVEAQLLSGAAPLPLLSTPTHAPYWLAPTELVKRLLRYEQAGQLPNFGDLALALARTAAAHPKAAAAARTQLQQLRHEGLRKLLDWLLDPAATALPSDLERAGQPAAAPGAGPATWADARPYLWAVAARTKAPTAEFTALTALVGDYPGVAQPWQPGGEFAQHARTYVDLYEPGRAEVTESRTELTVPPTTAGASPNPLLIYSLHAGFVPEPRQSMGRYLTALARDFPFLVALLPHHPDPLYWHALRLAAPHDQTDATARDVIGQGLRSLLPPGPPLTAVASLLLAVGLTHHAGNTRALALEVLLTATEEHRLQPAALGQALGRLLAAEFAPVPRLTGMLAQARAIDPETDDALRQTLDALLPTLPAAPPRNLRKLLEAYADVLARAPHPLPAAVRARLTDWQPQGSLKKAVTALLK